MVVPFASETSFISISLACLSDMAFTLSVLDKAYAEQES